MKVETQLATFLAGSIKAGSKEQIYVDAKESKVPQATARTHDWQSLARKRARVRRLRPESSRARLDYRPANRGQPGCDDAFRQARRQDLDSFVSGQACNQEARRNSYGKRQRRARSLGRGGSSRQDPV